MTKSIIDLIHDAKAYPLYKTHSVVIERLLALHRAAIIADLAQRQEPCPVFQKVEMAIDEIDAAIAAAQEKQA